MVVLLAIVKTLPTQIVAGDTVTLVQEQRPLLNYSLLYWPDIICLGIARMGNFRIG